MLAVTRMKMSDVKKSEQEHVRHFLHKSFWKFHVVVVQNNSKEMYKKKCAARAKLLPN